MAIRSSLGLLERTSDLIRTMGWTGLGQSAIGLLLLSIVLGFADILNALFNLPAQLLNSLTNVLVALQEGIFLGPLEFLGEGLAAAAATFGSGWTGLLGPFQGPFAVALLLIMVWEVLYFMDVVDSDFIGIVLDLPFINNDESEADSGED